MACYLIQDNKVYISEQKEKEQTNTFRTAENCIVEKKSGYWILSDLEVGTPLLPNYHFVIKNKTIFEAYCDVCYFKEKVQDKLCDECGFVPSDNEGTIMMMNSKELISSLSNEGYYEADRAVFNNVIRRKRGIVR